MKKSKNASPIILLAGNPGPRRQSPDPSLSAALRIQGIDSPSVAYLGSASGDHRMFFKMISSELEKCGAGSVTLAPTAGKRVDIHKTAHILESSDIIFVSGGDVEEGMLVLERCGLIPLLEKLHADGKPFIGLSAGSIMLAKQWIRWSDPDDDSTAEIFPCLGFAPIHCDTHSEEDEWTELRFLLELLPDRSLGYGLPAGSGLCVHPGGRLQAIEDNIVCFERIDGKVEEREPIEWKE